MENCYHLFMIWHLEQSWEPMEVSFVSTFVTHIFKLTNYKTGLLITPTIMTDLGVYECRVKSILDEEETASAYLNVQCKSKNILWTFRSNFLVDSLDKAKVVYAPKEMFFAYGHQAILDCHFRSNPPLTNLRWEKDGFLFDPYNVKDVFYKRNGSLFFSQVNDLHGGKYSCTPYNELGRLFNLHDVKLYEIWCITDVLIPFPIMN